MTGTLPLRAAWRSRRITSGEAAAEGLDDISRGEPGVQ